MQAAEQHIVDQGISIARTIEETNTMLTALQSHVGFLEGQLEELERARACEIPRLETPMPPYEVPQGEEPYCPGTPYLDIIDLTDDSNEPAGPPPVIDLIDDSNDDEEAVLIGGPLDQGHLVKWADDQWDARLGLIVPETPPPQEQLELMRETPIRDQDNAEAGRAADLLVCAGWALPEYVEDGGLLPYGDPPAYE